MTSDVPFFIFLPCFVVLWCSICWLLALMGGWSTLATYYRASKPLPSINWHGWRSIQIGRTTIFPVSYSNMAKIAFEEHDLFLSTAFLWRVGHQTLKLPYNEMNISLEKRFLRRTAKITMMKNSDVKIFLYGFDKERLIEKLSTS